MSFFISTYFIVLFEILKDILWMQWIMLKICLKKKKNGEKFVLKLKDLI